MTKMNKELKSCFIITPAGDPESETRLEADGLINAVIKPVLEDRYYVKAAHLSNYSMQITKEIIHEIYNADLIIANLTDLNPNVMYELALAHALRKPVVHLIREGQKPSFDINNQRYLTYRNCMHGVVELKDLLLDFVNSANLQGENVSNPITDAIDNIEIKQESRNINLNEVLTDIQKRLKSIESGQYKMINSSNRERHFQFDDTKQSSRTLRDMALYNYVVEIIESRKLNTSSALDDPMLVKELSRELNLPIGTIATIIEKYMLIND